jgi:hypothetical protein
MKNLIKMIDIQKNILISKKINTLKEVLLERTKMCEDAWK